MWLMGMLVLSGAARAVDLPATATCHASEAQLTANKQLVLGFFTFRGTLEAQAQKFLSKDYVQHNPRLLRLDGLTGAAGRDAWLKDLQEAQKRGIDPVDLPGVHLDQPLLLMAECDLVTALYRRQLADPDRPGQMYESFVFEIFRVRDGKLAEHWDQVTLSKGWMK